MRQALGAAALAILVACVTSAHALPGSTQPQLTFARALPSIYAEIWAANRHGRNKRRLISIHRAAAGDPAWSPSGRQIAFTVDRDPPAAGQVHIYVAGADGKGRRRLAGGRTQDYAPAWSPDGRKIAFAKASDGGFRSLGVFVMRADGRFQHRLTRNLCDDTPAWAPTGKLLVVSRCGSLFVVHADGTHARRLTTPPPPDPSGSRFSDGQPDWSPDGRWIAFVHTEELDRGGEIDNLYVIRPDGTGERQLTDGGDDLCPSWSPSGRQLAYASYTRIMAVTVASGQTRILVAIRGADLSSPTWR